MKIVFQKANEILFKDVSKGDVIIAISGSEGNGKAHGMAYFNKIRLMWNVMRPDGYDQLSDQPTLEDLIKKNPTWQFHKT